MADLYTDTMPNPASPIIAFDTETYYDKDYSVKTLGPSRYCRDSRFECYMVSVYDGESAWSGHPKDLNWDALSGAVWLSHNQTFDQTVYEEMVKRGQAPKIQRAGWKDTSHLSAYLCNRRSLKESCEFLLGGLYAGGPVSDVKLRALRCRSLLRALGEIRTLVARERTAAFGDDD